MLPLHKKNNPSPGSQKASHLEGFLDLDRIIDDSAEHLFYRFVFTNSAHNVEHNQHNSRQQSVTPEKTTFYQKKGKTGGSEQRLR